MGTLSWNGLELPFEKIKNDSPSDNKIVKFCHQWLTGQTIFDLPTSGSTGVPKIIQVSRKAMEISAAGTVSFLGLTSQNNALLCINPDYIGGKMMLVRSIIAGMNLRIVDSVANPFKLLEDNIEFDFAAMVPLQLQTILAESGLTAIERIKKIIIGGAPLDGLTETRLKSAGNEIYATFGMTETLSHIALRRINGPEATDWYTPLTNVITGTDQRGCLTITAPVTDNKTIITNDLVEIDEIGRFRWLGRIDNVINSGGIKTSPELLEKDIQEIFYTNGLNNRFFVTGIPDERLGSKIVLIIEGETGLQETHIQSLLQTLPKFQVPKRIYFIQEFIETGSSKVNRIETLKKIEW